MAELFRESGDGHAGQSFCTYRINYGPQRAVVDAVREWAKTWPDRRDGGEGLVLYGPCGTGKDHLAMAAAATVCYSFDATIRWRNGRELFAAFRDAIGQDESETATLNGLCRCDLLVLSDPLPPRGEISDFQADVLYRIAKGRTGRPTILTLNVSSEAEADRRLGAPTWDRFQGKAWILKCEWPSHRRPARRVNC